MASKKRVGKKAKRGGIVPRTVFAVTVACASVPSLSACSASRGDVASVAARMDLGGVAAIRDMGTDGSDAGRDAGGPDMFGVADIGPPDMIFAVAVPIDLGSDATFSVTAPLDGSFSVAAPIDS